MNWISVKDRLPDCRREVLTWGHASAFGLKPLRSHCLGISRANIGCSGGRFDIERRGWRDPFVVVVTHWCEIEGPVERESEHARAVSTIDDATAVFQALGRLLQRMKGEV